MIGWDWLALYVFPYFCQQKHRKEKPEDGQEWGKRDEGDVDGSEMEAFPEYSCVYGVCVCDLEY